MSTPLAEHIAFVRGHDKPDTLEQAFQLVRNKVQEYEAQRKKGRVVLEIHMDEEGQDRSRSVHLADHQIFRVAKP